MNLSDEDCKAQQMLNRFSLYDRRRYLKLTYSSDLVDFPFIKPKSILFLCPVLYKEVVTPIPEYGVFHPVVDRPIFLVSLDATRMRQLETRRRLWRKQ